MLRYRKIESLNYVFDSSYKKLKDNFLIHVNNCDIPVLGHEINYEDSNDDLSHKDSNVTKKFFNSIIKKVELIIKSIKESKGAVIWSDLDIIFLKPFDQIKKQLTKKINQFDIAISPEWTNYLNSGFFVCACNEKTIDFFNNVLTIVKERKVLEQQVINAMLGKKFYDTNDFEGIEKYDIKWTPLPDTYWNLTLQENISKETMLIHANWIFGFKKFSNVELEGSHLEIKKQILDFLLKEYCIKSS